MTSIDLLLSRLHSEMAATNVQLSLWKLACAVDRAIKAGYRPDQLRVPAGSSGGGQWTHEIGEAARIRRERAIARIRSTARGHHYVPRSIYNKLPLPAETWKVFDAATTGRLYAQRHGSSAEHDLYNDAVQERLDRFVIEKGIQIEQMTPDQAREFVNVVKQSTDARIRNFNWQILMREVLRLRPRLPRGLD